jgi:hypothetical protein
VNNTKALAPIVEIIVVLAAILFVARFVYSRFSATSELSEDRGGGSRDPYSPVPVRRKGGPKGKTAAATVEPPDEP